MKTKGSRNLIRGKVLNKFGYVEVFEPSHPIAKKNGYVLEHRMVVYDAGLLTDSKMEVHHINGIKNDNRLINLIAMTKENHTSITWKGVRRSEKGNPCKFCDTKTRSKYGLCRVHYKLEWQRGNIYQTQN